MRQDFRIKVDLSRIYQDIRSHSWVFIDSTKIFLVRHLADHVQQLFDIGKQFHLMSKYEEVDYYLPFEEDVRILQSNDTVSVMPGAVLSKNYPTKSFQECSQNNGINFVKPSSSQEKKSSIDSGKCSFVSEKSSYVSDQSSVQNKIDSSDTVSLSGSFYRTAIHETLNDSQDSKITEDNLTEDNSIAEETTGSNKRKRVRKRKSKKNAETLPESDISMVETTGKKPKIIDSILISSGKHIRFKGLDDDDAASDGNIANNNDVPTYKQNGDVNNKKAANNDLQALLSLRQSSTPLTFTHRRIKREFKPEPIIEKEISAETSVTSSKSNGHFDSPKSSLEMQKSKETSVMSNCTTDDDTVSFKVYRIGEDYTPQLSSVILAKVMSVDPNDSQYTLKILHGIEQLKVPEGKFSLPQDDEEMENEPSDIITLDKSQLIELSKVTAIDSPR